MNAEFLSSREVPTGFPSAPMNSMRAGFSRDEESHLLCMSPGTMAVLRDNVSDRGVIS